MDPGPWGTNCVFRYFFSSGVPRAALAAPRARQGRSKRRRGAQNTPKWTKKAPQIDLNSEMGWKIFAVPFVVVVFVVAFAQVVASSS